MSDRQPVRVGPYQVERPLGRGGMGVVYAAWDERLRRRVALKHVAPEVAGDERKRERIRREARAVARLEHSAIVQIYDLLLDTPEGDWIVLQYVEGPTLAQRLQQGPLPPAEVVALGKDVAGALKAAHAQGLLHRDLKAENVILTPGGGAKVLDFGLAKPLQPETMDDPALTAGIVGTCRAMSPEQANGLELGPRSDLFSLGVLLYEAATAVSPFRASTPVGTMMRVCTLRHKPISALQPRVPAELSQLIDALLEKAPAARPASAEQVLQVLAKLEAPGSGGLFSGPDKHDTPAARASGSAPASSGASSSGARWKLLVALLTLALVLGAALMRLPSREPLYVVVARPALGGASVVGADEDSDARLSAVALEAALLRSLATLEGVVALPADRTESDADAQRLAKVHAADEVVDATLDCEARHCLATLRRLRGSDGRLLGVETFEAPSDDVSLVAAAGDAYLRALFPSLAARDEGAELNVRAEDYPRYLRLKRQWEERRPTDVAPLLAELATLRAGSPRFVDGYLLEARALLARYTDTRSVADLERAIEVVERAREEAPRDPQPLALLFRIHLVGGRLDDAEQAAADLAALVPGDAGALYREALLEEARGRGARALVLLRQAADRRPSADVLLELARMHLRQGHAGAVRATLEELLWRVPGQLLAERLLAQVELQSGDPARAARLYEGLLSRRRGFSELSNLGVARMLMRDYAGAAASLEEAYQLAPRNASAALNLADARTLAGRPAEAAPLYARVLELAAADPDPDHWQSLTVKAQALAHLGRGQEAAAAIQQATGAAPDNAQLAYEAALVFAVIGDRSSALASAERALARGFDRRWFALPFFDSLEDLPAWAPLLVRDQGS